MGLQEVRKWDSNNTNVNDTELNNVKRNGSVENSNDTLENTIRERDEINENFAGYLAYELEDEKSIGFYRKVARTIPHCDVMQMLGILKDNRDKVNNKGAYFTALVKKYASENNLRVINF